MRDNVTPRSARIRVLGTVQTVGDQIGALFIDVSRRKRGKYSLSVCNVFLFNTRGVCAQILELQRRDRFEFQFQVLSLSHAYTRSPYITGSPSERECAKTKTNLAPSSRPRVANRSTYHYRPTTAAVIQSVSIKYNVCDTIPYSVVCAKTYVFVNSVIFLPINRFSTFFPNRIFSSFFVILNYYCCTANEMLSSEL